MFTLNYSLNRKNKEKNNIIDFMVFYKKQKEYGLYCQVPKDDFLLLYSIINSLGTFVQQSKMSQDRTEVINSGENDQEFLV